ncbi:sensor histidine kinase [Clostridium tunisiense]|uniref:sensor histidine kinase n=1 Tax=Clostridium tunisiense TaxID=219748 RepID=UPI0002DD744D|nr:sensor histidine kinase [Clostridium tunisiense]
MKKKDVFNLVLFYLKARLKGSILLILCCLTFALVFFLYNVPTEPIVYASVLCAIVAVVLLIIDFLSLYRKHKLLQDLKNNIAFKFDNLPQPKDIIERDYYDLLTIIYKQNLGITHNAEVNQSNLIDYYTLWAHQIKTPISAIHLILQTEDNELSSELSTELFKIEQYVEFVLQYLRLESMSSDLVLKSQSLDNIVKQAVRKYARMFIRKRIKMDFKDLNCEVLTDEKWLLFAIEQLLSNALKYTREGTISIYMDGASEKTLVIEDTGIGIKEEDLARIFERGFTGYNGRWDKRSTGLGLYLCKQILNKLSHGISIESRVDEGTKVKINLETIQVGIE